MDYYDWIVSDPQIRFGKPTVRGTRITVGDALSYLASGMSEAEILAERERVLWSIPAAEPGPMFVSSPGRGGRI